MVDNIKVEEVQPDGTKKEVKMDPSTGYHNYLIAFNAIIDLDFSILRMIQAEYNNPKFINQEIMGMTTKQVRHALINRDDPNPVTICIKDKQIADSIYKEIMNKRYTDLLKEDKYLSLTGIFFLISVYTAMENVHVSVLCTNKEEEAVVRKYHSKVNIITMEDPSEINLDEYTEFIFKDKNDVYKFKNKFNEKRILLLNYKFNVTFDDKPYPDVEVSHYLWTHGFSKTAIIDTYRNTDPDYATLRFVIKKKPKNN